WRRATDAPINRKLTYNRATWRTAWKLMPAKYGKFRMYECTGAPNLSGPVSLLAKTETEEGPVPAQAGSGDSRECAVSDTDSNISTMPASVVAHQHNLNGRARSSAINHVLRPHARTRTSVGSRGTVPPTSNAASARELGRSIGQFSERQSTL